MKLVADEGVDAAIVRRLREDGNDVFYVAEQTSGFSDEDLSRLRQPAGYS